MTWRATQVCGGELDGRMNIKDVMKKYKTIVFGFLLDRRQFEGKRRER